MDSRTDTGYILPSIADAIFRIDWNIFKKKKRLVGPLHVERGTVHDSCNEFELLVTPDFSRGLKNKKIWALAQQKTSWAKAHNMDFKFPLLKQGVTE